MAVLELPPKFSRKSQVKTESRYGMKSVFFDFFPFEADCKLTNMGFKGELDDVDKKTYNFS